MVELMSDFRGTICTANDCRLLLFVGASGTKNAK